MHQFYADTHSEPSHAEPCINTANSKSANTMRKQSPVVAYHSCS
jgi:hypothetical protein